MIGVVAGSSRRGRAIWIAARATTSSRGTARTGALARPGTAEMELGIADLKPFLPGLEDALDDDAISELRKSGLR